MIEALIEAPRALPCQLVLDEKPAAERKEKGDGRNRDRTAHAVRRGHKSDSGLGAGGHIDVVVADADLGDQAEPMVGRDALSCESWKKQDQRIMICKAGSGQDAVLWLDKTDFDIGVRRQRRKIEHRFALVLDVESKRDPPPTHLNTPPICSQLMRSGCSASHDQICDG